MERFRELKLIGRGNYGTAHLVEVRGGRSCGGAADAAVVGVSSRPRQRARLIPARVPPAPSPRGVQDPETGDLLVVKKIGASGARGATTRGEAAPAAADCFADWLWRRRRAAARAPHTASRTTRLALFAPPALPAAIYDMSDAEREQAKQEVVLLSSLRHPCIVSYKGSFIQDGQLHILMQYCENGDLASKIKQARRAHVYFEEGQILDWFAQLAMAVSYIHRRRVLHRDLKTQNIFLTRSNMVRLGDFGIARVLEHTFEQVREGASRVRRTTAR
jgi:serine/threonine protein kinase